MRRSIFHKIFSCLVLVILVGEKFDFLIFTAAGPSRSRSLQPHEKCYCSDCYDQHEGCLCWTNPDAEEKQDSTASTTPIIQACNCAPQQAGGTLPLSETKYWFDPILALRLCFPLESDWPEDKSFFLTDLFAPPVFHPPET